MKASQNHPDPKPSRKGSLSVLIGDGKENVLHPSVFFSGLAGMLMEFFTILYALVTLPSNSWICFITLRPMVDLTDPIKVIIIFRLSYFKNDISRTLSFPLKKIRNPMEKGKKLQKIKMIILRRK